MFHFLSNCARTQILLVAFVISFVSVIFMFYNFPSPSLEPDELKMPKNVSDVKGLADVLSKYQTNNYSTVLLGFCTLYLFLQTFAIPGTLLLSILSGALFPCLMALFLVTVCSTSGASLCYGLSWYFGRDLVIKYFPNKLRMLQKQIEMNHDNIFFYLLFLRLTPFLPNWFINLAAPIINIQYLHFCSATLLGLIPANWLYIQVGMTLQSISNDALDQGHFVLSYKSLFFLFSLAIFALIPTFVKKKYAHLR